MTTYDFECYCKGIQPIIKTLNVPMSELYTPICPNCEKPMKRVFGCNIIAGALDRNHLPKC